MHYAVFFSRWKPEYYVVGKKVAVRHELNRPTQETSRLF